MKPYPKGTQYILNIVSILTSHVAVSTQSSLICAVDGWRGDGIQIMFFKSVFINERKGLLASEDPIPVDHELLQFSCCPRHDYKTMLDLVESDPGVINRVVGGCKKTLLHCCIEYHRPCMVEYLLKKDALQLMDAAGNVPLHIAAR